MAKQILQKKLSAWTNSSNKNQKRYFYRKSKMLPPLKISKQAYLLFFQTNLEKFYGKITFQQKIFFLQYPNQRRIYFDKVLRCSGTTIFNTQTNHIKNEPFPMYFLKPQVSTFFNIKSLMCPGVPHLSFGATSLTRCQWLSDFELSCQFTVQLRTDLFLT